MDETPAPPRGSWNVVLLWKAAVVVALEMALLMMMQADPGENRRFFFEAFGLLALVIPLLAMSAGAICLSSGRKLITGRTLLPVLLILAAMFYFNRVLLCVVSRC